MENKRTLVWVFRGKLEWETLDLFGVTQRAKQLQNCMRCVTVYLLTEAGEIKELTPFWTVAENPPEEVKLFALLNN